MKFIDYTFYAVSGSYVYKQVGQSVTQSAMQEADFSFQNDMQLSLLNSVNNDYTQEAIKLLENEKSQQPWQVL
ncbi:MAG: hypothetical protein LUG21_03230 [Clostridiales bacterium]|nr:hypothetical protein [Clostridiales bacterium]